MSKQDEQLQHVICLISALSFFFIIIINRSAPLKNVHN